MSRGGEAGSPTPTCGGCALAKKSAAVVVQLWAGKCERRTLAVFRDSAQRLTTEANRPQARGGKMPVDTRFLRGSLVASLTGLPDEQSQPVELVLLDTRIGDTIWIGWTANYARAMEARYAFMRSAA